MQLTFVFLDQYELPESCIEVFRESFLKDMHVHEV
jgi:hypothetical protein